MQYEILTKGYFGLRTFPSFRSGKLNNLRFITHTPRIAARLTFNQSESWVLSPDPVLYSPPCHAPPNDRGFNWIFVAAAAKQKKNVKEKGRRGRIQGYKNQKKKWKTRIKEPANEWRKEWRIAIFDRRLSFWFRFAFCLLHQSQPHALSAPIFYATPPHTPTPTISYRTGSIHFGAELLALLFLGNKVYISHIHHFWQLQLIVCNAGSNGWPHLRSWNRGWSLPGRRQAAGGRRQEAGGAEWRLLKPGPFLLHFLLSDDAKSSTRALAKNGLVSYQSMFALKALTRGLQMIPFRVLY